MGDDAAWAFVPHETEVWAVAEVTKDSGGQVTVSAASQYGGDSTSLRSSEVVRISSLETLNQAPPDLIKLLDVNRPSILYSLCKRFNENEIYTAIGPVLVAVNPFKWITGLYAPALVPKYKKEEYNLADHPHLFAMAAGAVRGLTNGFKQSLIISGESGSGKTEATKQCLYFLTQMTDGEDLGAMSNGHSQQGRRGRTESSSEEQPESLAALTGVQGRILSASPVLEAFGNAKTIRNNNSSRFGKFIEIYLGAEQKAIESSTNTTYLLEKSRVVKREKEERNYHIFYQLLAGYSPELLEKLGLKDLSKNLAKINYLDGCTSITGVDDGDEFSKVMSALESLAFSEEDIDHLMTMLAGILHLGQVSFVNDPKTDGSKMSNHSDAEHSLPHAASTLGVTEAALKQSLLFKTIKTKAGNRTSIMFKPYSKEAATDNRDAMAKEIYTRIFDWIVQKVNEAVNPADELGSSAQRYAGGLKNTAGDGRGFIGILDIFGFEIFQKNSLEQLCINFANESLQHHFNYHIFTGEMELYEREGIGGVKLDYKDNKNVLDLLMKRPTGILCLLDEEVKVPRGSDDGFVNKCIRAHEKNPIFKNRHKIRSFGVVHYAGVVDYQKEGFLQKNNDTLSSDVVELLNESSTGLMKAIFSDSATEAKDAELLRDAGMDGASGAGAKPGPQSKANKMTVAKRFTLQLDSLIKQLNTTQPKYIRCIKPNDNKVPNEIDKVLLDQQLDYSGVFDAVHIMQSGYPVKLKLAGFVSRYHGLAINLPVDSEGVAERGSEVKERRKGAKGARSAFRNGGYDTIFPRRKGTVLSGSSAAKFEATVTHDTVAKLLALLVTEKGITPAKEVIVGKTMVFYRPEPADLLEKALRAQRKAAAIFLQKNMRYLIYNKFTVGILEPYKKLKAAILAKDGPLLKQLLVDYPTGDLVDTLEVLLGSAMMKFFGSFSAGRGGGYGLEVNRKTRIVAEEASTVLNRHLMLKELLREGIERSDVHPDAVFGEYDELVSNMKALKDNSLHVDNYPFKFDSWEWAYEQDEEAVDMCRKIDNYALVVTIKRRFDKHSDVVSEGDLAGTLEDLINLRTSGDLPPTYCLNEEERARSIVKNAIDIYMEYYDLMVEALGDGGMKVDMQGGGGLDMGSKQAQSQAQSQSQALEAAAQTRKSLVGAMFGPSASAESLADMFSSELDYTVNSKTLSGVFNRWDKHKELHDQSQKTADLVEIGRSLIYLREYAENKQWKTLWKALNNNGWMELIPCALKAGETVPKRQSLSIGASVDLQLQHTDPSLDAITEGDEEEAEDKAEKDEDYMPPPPARRPTIAPGMPSLAAPVSVPADDPDVMAAAALEAKVEEEELLPPLEVRPLFQLYTLQKAPYFVDVETGKLHWTVPAGHSLSSVAFLSHISEEEAAATSGEVVDEASMKMYFENVATQEVTWTMPTLPAEAAEHIAGMYVGSIPECEALVGQPYEHDRGQDHLIAIDDYLESENPAQALDNDGYSQESREAANSEIARRNQAVREEVLARHLLEAKGRADAEAKDSAIAAAAAVAVTAGTKKEKGKANSDKPKKHGSVHETAKLSTLQLLHVVKQNDDLYEGTHSVGHGVTIPKGLEAVLGREIYNMCYSCLHYSCFREIASILTDTRSVSDALSKDFVPAYERRASSTIIGGEDETGMEWMHPHSRSSVAFLNNAPGIGGDRDGEVRGEMVPLVCNGLEIDLARIVPGSWNRLLGLISEAGQHEGMFDSNQMCLFYLAKRHTRLHEGVFVASTDADALEATMDSVCAIAALSGEPSHHMWIDRAHGDVRIAASALAFYRYRSALSKYVFKALLAESLPAPVVPKNRKKSRRSTQRMSILTEAAALSATGDTSVDSIGASIASIAAVADNTALNFNSVGKTTISTFESLIAGATNPAKCPPIRESELGQWEELMSIAEVAWTVRGAVNEIDSSRVKLDSVSPLNEADEGEVTAVLALLEAVKENEAWINKYVGEEAAKALSPRRGDAPGAGEDMADGAGEIRGRERQPSKSGARRSSSGEKKKGRRTRFGSTGQSPPPPTSDPPPEKVAKAKARKEARASATAAGAGAGGKGGAREESGERYQHAESTFGKSLHSHAGLVIKEMDRVESELQHILAISSIAKALLHGAVRGEVGALKVEEIDYNTLPQVIAKHMPRVQMNPSINMLMEDADLLTGLRKMMRLQDMDEVGRIITPIAKNDPLFLTCHKNTRDELQLIYMEYTQYWCKQRLHGILRSGSLAVSQNFLKDDSAVSACGDPMGIDLLELTAITKTKKRESVYQKLSAQQEALQEAIKEVESAATRTPEVHQLLFDAKIAHAVRKTAMLGQWEPLLANQSLTWGALDAPKLALLLCTTDQLKGQVEGDGGQDLLAPPSMSDRDPLLTVLGKGMVLQDDPDEESGDADRRRPSAPPAPPPPSSGHGQRRDTSFHPSQPPPPSGGPKHGKIRSSVAGNPDAPPVPSAARVHFDESVPMPVAPKPLVPRATSIDRKKKRRLIVDLPVKPSPGERLACAMQVIEAVSSLDTPMSTQRVPLVSIAINSVLHAGETGQSQDTGAISHDNAALASGLTVAEILSFLEHLAAPDKQTFNDVVIQDLPLESWEAKFNNGDSSPAAPGGGAKARVAQSNVLSNANTVFTSGGKELPMIRRVEHPAVLADLHHAIRLSHDRKARVLLAVSVLAGQVSGIESLEKEVNERMERYHRDCEHYNEVEDTEALKQAPTQLREDVTRTVSLHVDKDAAKKGLKCFYSMLHMTGTYDDYPFEKPPVTIETTPDGMGMLSGGYLTETVRCWWLIAQHLVHVRSAIMKQVDSYLARELEDDEEGRRESTIRRRRASSMLDSYALGSLGTIENHSHKDEDELWADEDELRDDHFELKVGHVGLLHAGIVDKTLHTTRDCYSLPTLSASQELKTLRKLYVDFETREKLQTALCTGGPSYDKEGRFVCTSSQVDTETLAGILGQDGLREEEHVASGARGKFFRSARLERLKEFAKTCLSLRRGLLDNNWTDSEYAVIGEASEASETSEKGGEDGGKAGSWKRAPPLRTVIGDFHESMRRYGTKSSYYDAVMTATSGARGLTSDDGDGDGDGEGEGMRHLEGIPPKRLVQDFVMVEHELQKLDILSAYNTQYRQGALTGDSLKLNLQHIDTKGLEQAVNSIAKWRYQKRLLPVQKAFKDKLDSHMATHLKAAQELITVRKEIIAINEQFRRSLPVVPSGPNRVMMLKDFMARYNIVGAAMQTSLDNCTSLFDLPQNITQIWDTVDNLVSHQCVHAGKLGFMHHELRLMKEESLSRRFLWAQVRIFNSINNTDIVANKGAALETMSDLAKNFLQFNDDLRTLSKFANKVVKPSPVVEAVATSSALLFHLIRAQLFTDCYEKLRIESEQGAFEVPAIFDEGDDIDEAKERHELQKLAVKDKKAKIALQRRDEHRKLGSRLRRRKENVDAMLHTLGKVIEEPHAEWRNCKGALTSEALVGKHGTPSVQLLKMSCGGTHGDDVASDLRNTVELIAKMCAPLKKKRGDGVHGDGGGGGEGFDKEEISDGEEDRLNDPPSDDDDDDDAFKGTHATLAELEQEITGDYHSYAAMTYAREEHEKKRQSFQIFSVQAVIRSYFRHTESENGDGMGALGTLQVSAFKLHPVVRRKFLNAITDTANTFDIHDMKRALQVRAPQEPGQAVGEPGKIPYQLVGNKPLIHVLARIRNEKDEINRFNLITGFSASEMASYITSKAPTRKAPVPPGGAPSGGAASQTDNLEARAAREGESESFRRLYADLGAEQYPESFRRQLALKFLRMSNMLPEKVVRARMRSEGISDRDVEVFFENLYSGGSDDSSDGTNNTDSPADGSGSTTAAGAKGSLTQSKHDVSLDQAFSNRRRKMANESILLQRSCEIIACMRDIIVRQDYRSGFDLLEMFITPIAEEMTDKAASADAKVQPSGGSVKTPDAKNGLSVSIAGKGAGGSAPGSSGRSPKKGRPSQTMSVNSHGSIGTRVFYNLVHDHCRQEFELLTMDICMGFWRALEGSTLAPGVYLKIYTSLLMLSEQSPAMRSLCGESIRLIDEGRTADLSKALSPAAKKKKEQDMGGASEEGKGGGSDDSEGDESGTWRDVNGKGEKKKKKEEEEPAGPKKRLPPLKETPIELLPAAARKEGAPKMAATEYSAASAVALAQTDSDASVISRNEPDVLAKKGPRGEILKKLSHCSSQTDGTDLLEVVDPVYHMKHQELVKSKEDATRRLAAMRAEKERVLALLNLREIESAKKVKQKEEESIGVIQRMWDNDAKRVEHMRSSLEEERVQYELDMKAQRHAEFDIHALYNHRREQLAATAIRLKHHHETVLGQRKYAAHARLRADMGTRRLQSILARKLDVEKLRIANKEKSELHKRTISASSALYASADKGASRGRSAMYESKK